MTLKVTSINIWWQAVIVGDEQVVGVLSRGLVRVLVQIHVGHGASQVRTVGSISIAGESLREGSRSEGSTCAVIHIGTETLVRLVGSD